MAKTLNIALAGAGMISWHHLVAWRNLGARARVIAVCDPDTARAASRAEEFSIPRTYGDADTMFGAETIDAIDVASPRARHANWVDAGAARAIDGLCRNPMTPPSAVAGAVVGP